MLTGCLMRGDFCWWSGYGFDLLARRGGGDVEREWTWCGGCWM